MAKNKEPPPEEPPEEKKEEPSSEKPPPRELPAPEEKEEEEDGEEEEESKESIFSEKSLDRISSSEQIDKLIVVVTPKGWIALTCLFGLIIAALIWSFVGEIPIQVHGKGIILTQRGLFPIDVSRKGLVKNVLIKPGDWVTTNTVVANLYDQTLETELFTAKVKMELISSFLEDVNKEIQAGKSPEEVVKEFLQKYRESITKQIEQAQAENKAKLWSQESTLDEIEIKIKKDKPYFDILSSLQDQLFHTTEEYTKLQQQEFEMQIYPPAEGQILELYVEKGDWVSPGDSFALAKYPLLPGETHLCFAFFSIGSGEKIHANMGTKMRLENVDDKVYGFLLGETGITTGFPISDLSLLNRMRNPQLVSFLKQDSTAVIRTVIYPTKNVKTPSGYTWTTQSGPPDYVLAGTICDVMVTIRTRRPISYLLPELFKKPSTIKGPNPDVFPK